jgi:hypothetical protein
MNFGRAEQARYKKSILPIFGDFLRRCYSKSILFISNTILTICSAPEECRASALQAVRESVAPHPSTSAGDPDLFAQNLPPPDVDTTSEYGPRSTRVPTLSPSPAVLPLTPSSASATVVTDNPFSCLVDELPDLRGDGAQGKGTVSVVPTITSSTSTVAIQPRLKTTVQRAGSRQGPGVQAPDAGLTSVNTLNDAAQRGQLKRALHETFCTGEDDQLEPRVSKRKRAPAQDSKATSALNKSKQPSRRKGAGPSSFPPQSAAPPWFLSGRILFSGQGLGKEWDELISMWETFEAKEGYKEVGRPTASGRPEVVSQWISRARSVTWRPNILDVKGYEAKYNEWWKRLQPEWRVVNGRVDVGLTQGNWESLRLPGLNGFLSIISALFYWGLAVQGKSIHHNAWLSALQDCHLVISLLSV